MKNLAFFRQQINHLDDQLIKLLAERQAICQQVAVFKKENNIPVMQEARVKEVIERCTQLGFQYKLDPIFIKNLYQLIIHKACELEKEVVEI